MTMDSHLSARDPQLVLNIVNHLKSQGIFDQFRRECLADVDTKPSFQNLRQRVEGYVSKFLSQQTWKPDLNKNQLRDALRKQINDSGMLSIGVEHVVDQVVNPQISRTFLPQIESVVRQYLGLERPTESGPTSEKKEERKENVLCLDFQEHGQKTFVKMECELAENTKEVILVPEVSKKEMKDQENEGFPAMNTVENLNTPIMEKLSEVLASTESSQCPNSKPNSIDSVTVKVGDYAHDIKKTFEIYHSTGDTTKASGDIETVSTICKVEKSTNFEGKFLSNFEDDVKKDVLSVKQNDNLNDILFDENSASCADSIDDDSKLIINEDSMTGELNLETEDSSIIDNENKDISGSKFNSESEGCVSKNMDDSKNENPENKLDPISAKDIIQTFECGQESILKDARVKTNPKKETEDVKCEMVTKDTHRKQEKEKSPNKHKVSKSSDSPKPKQNDNKSNIKHKHSSKLHVKEPDKLHKHSSSSKCSSSKSHCEYKSKSSTLNKLDSKHKSSSSSSSHKSSEKSSKSSQSSSSSKVLSNSKGDGKDNEKKHKYSKMPSSDHKHQHSSVDTRAQKPKTAISGNSSKDGSKSAKETNEKTKSHSKVISDSKLSSSLHKHKSLNSSKSHDKYKNKDYSKHSSSSKLIDKHKHSDSRSIIDIKHVKRLDYSSSSSSKQNVKSSKSDEKTVLQDRNKSQDYCRSSFQEGHEKLNSSESSNTCTSDSTFKECKNKDSLHVSHLSPSERKKEQVPADKSVIKPQLKTPDVSDENGTENKNPVGEVENTQGKDGEQNNNKTCEGKDSDVNKSEIKSSRPIPKEDSSSSMAVVEITKNTTSDCTTKDLQYSFQGKLKPCNPSKVKPGEPSESKQVQTSQCQDTNSESASRSISLPVFSTSSVSVTSIEKEQQLPSEMSEGCSPNPESRLNEEKIDLMRSLVLQKSDDKMDSLLDEMNNTTLSKKEVNERGDDKKSDITVSSVHTSDLSSYDDKISLSSSDELEAVESVKPTVKEKKVALKEIKEVAATYMKSRTNSSGRSTPVLPSGDDDTNQSSTKQLTEKSKLEQGSHNKEEEDDQHSDDDDGSRAPSRFGRQRKVNPKYASEEYIISSSLKDTDSPPAAVLPERRFTRRSAEENIKPSNTVSTAATSDSHITQNPERKRRYSKSSEKSTKGDEEHQESIPEKDVKTSLVVNQTSSEEVLTRSKRKSVSRSSISPDAAKNRAEHQRYSSSDLYKPRPLIGSRRQRTNDTTSTEPIQEQTSPDPAGNQKRPRGRPRKRPHTPEPQPAPSAKRKR